MSSVQRIIPEEIKKLIKEGKAEVYGGVVRFINSGSKNGQIIQHLQFPMEDNLENYTNILNQLGSLDKKFESATEVIGMLQKAQGLGNVIGVANLAMSGLNLCVTAVGFTVVINKLTKINGKLDSIQSDIDELKTNETNKLKKEIKEMIGEARCHIDNEKNFPNENIDSNRLLEIDKLINRFRSTIEDLIIRKNSKDIKLDDSAILNLYDIYIGLNKYRVYKNSSNKNFSIENHTDNVNLVKKINSLIKDKVLRNYIIKEMYLNEHKIFNSNEIEETVKVMDNIYDYNIEILDSQGLYLNPPSNAKQIIKEYQFSQ